MHHLIQRSGPKPRTTNSTPHEQLDQTSPPAISEQLWQRMLSLPDTSARPSGIAPHGSRALWLNASATMNTAAFMVGREFVHLHPAYDASLHLILPADWYHAALAAGWVEPHPLANMNAPGILAMAYGPRDTAELDVIWSLVQQAHQFACGQTTDAKLACCNHH